MLFLPKLGKFFCPDFNKLLVSLRLLLPTLKDDEECHSPGCFDKQTMHNVQYAGIFTMKVFNAHWPPKISTKTTVLFKYAHF